MREKEITLGGVAALLVVIGLLPLLVMFIKSVMPEGYLTLHYYQALLTAPRFWRLLMNSLSLALSVTIFSLVFGLSLAILLGKTDLPLRRFFAALLVIPLLIPPYILAVCWFFLLGKTGLLVRITEYADPALAQRIGEVASSVLFSIFGCTGIMVSTFMPFVMLLGLIFLRSIDPELEESARLDLGWINVLRRITIPLMRPGILLSAMLVFLLSLGEVGVPMFLRQEVFSNESFTRFSAFYDYAAGTASAIPLAGIALLLLGAESRFLREQTYRLQPSYQAANYSKIHLGGAKKYWLVAMVAFCFLAVFLPLTVLLLESISLTTYREAFARGWDSLLRSLLFAALGASLITILGFFAGYLIHTRALRLWRKLDSLLLLLFALPSTITGIGLIGLWNHPYTNIVYATPIIILLGYVARYTALGSRITVSTLMQLSPEMEEVAMIDGASWWQRMLRIVAPLAKPGLAGAWLVGFIFCLGDTGITMMVYPPGMDTLPVRIFTLMANGPPDLISALCILMVGTVLLPAGALWLVIRHRSDFTHFV